MISRCRGISKGIRSVQEQQRAVRPIGARRLLFWLFGTEGRREKEGLERREEGLCLCKQRSQFSRRTLRRVCTSPRSITFVHLFLLFPPLSSAATTAAAVAAVAALPPPFPSVTLYLLSLSLSLSVLPPLSRHFNSRQRTSPDRRLLKLHSWNEPTRLDSTRLDSTRLESTRVNSTQPDPTRPAFHREGVSDTVRASLKLSAPTAG